MARIGVYVCHCGLNIAGVIDVKGVAEFAGKLPDVEIARDNKYLCSDAGQKLIKEDIEKLKLERVVVASCSPRMHEATFREAVEKAGLNPYLLEMTNIREQDSWCHSEKPEEATQKAKALIKMAVNRAARLEPLERGRIKANRSVLVVGGGIAGIQASLDLAKAGFKVFLVEKSPSIGGRMAQLDKTFPTLDCSACILTPRMAEVGRHPSIELLTYSEVESLTGFVGNFEATIRTKPRYIDSTQCTGCGECEKVCPISIPSEFDLGLKNRKAVYRPFPQAIPNVFTIDMNACVECLKCEKACELPDVIDHKQKEEHRKITVGSVIVTVGCEVFDASLVPALGYGIYPNVISNIEFERLSNAAGPTGGKILNLETKEPPKSVAFIQCVGSRDKRFYTQCCRIGCMVTLKQAILIKEKLGQSTDVCICHNDMRSFGKAYEEFYERARQMGIRFIKGLPSEVKLAPNGSLSFDVYESNTQKLLEIHADLIVLASGLTPGADFSKVQEVLRIQRSPDGFFLEAHPKLQPLETPTRGIFLAGTCHSPKDIPDTVAQASGAAMKAVELLITGEVEIDPFIAVVEENLCSGCRICESVCPYQAIEMKTQIADGEEKEVASVLAAVCQGCGACSVACPTTAIDMQHYRRGQIMAQITALVQGGDKR